jgi:hypothetical protein
LFAGAARRDDCGDAENEKGAERLYTSFLTGLTEVPELGICLLQLSATERIPVGRVISKDPLGLVMMA